MCLESGWGRLARGGGGSGVGRDGGSGGGSLRAEVEFPDMSGRKRFNGGLSVPTVLDRRGGVGNLGCALLGAFDASGSKRFSSCEFEVRGAGDERCEWNGEGSCALSGANN